MKTFTDIFLIYIGETKDSFTHNKEYNIFFYSEESSIHYVLDDENTLKAVSKSKFKLRSDLRKEKLDLIINPDEENNYTR